MADNALKVLLVVALSTTLLSFVDANAFLKASHLKEERMSEEDVQTSLLAEVEGTFGEGSASSRVKQLEASLGPIYAALPKNEKGYLGHATVRYALHRLFVQRHGWSINGLDAAGGHRNSTASAGLLKEQVPAYIQDLFEQRLAGRGFGLHELGVLAATIEHLVHSEAIKRLGKAFLVHNFLPTSVMSELEADDVLDTYMTSYILGEDLTDYTLAKAISLKEEMPDVYLGWNDTKEFVRSTRRNVTKTETSAEQRSAGGLDFSLVARVAERVGERFGSFQDKECHQIKSSLVNIEERGTGRVRLSDFYKPAMDGQWQFQESVAYLRELGALDETDAEKPRVIIANYITSPSNCIASSSFYAVCCMDECEGLLGHLERQIAAPEATSTRIATLVSELPSSSVAAPRKLSTNLLDRLGEIAAEHGGSVPLHGRLFAQWMHHAFPRECPYPHLSGTTNPLTADEWLASTGNDTTATEAEMSGHVTRAEAVADTKAKNANELGEEGMASLPWSAEEELLVVRPPQMLAAGNSWCTSFLSTMRNIVFVAALSGIAYHGLSNGGARSASKVTAGSNADKFFV